MSKENKFNFFVPSNMLQKSFQLGEDGKEKAIEIEGICLTSQKDRQQEELIPKDFDFTPLLKSGFLNWNHQASSTSKAIIGEPTAIEVRDDGASLFVKGIIYPNAEGKSVVDLANTLESYSPNRRLGFSIEGTAITRDPSNPKKVTKAVLTGLAVTHCPVGYNTLMNIVKGDYKEAYHEETEESEKAMEADLDLQKESVEGKKKEVLEEERLLNKAEIYQKLTERFNFQNKNEVYELISNIDMKTNPIKTGDLAKAMKILAGEEIAKSEDQKKSEEKDEKKDDAAKGDASKKEGDEEEDEKGLEKATNFITIAESLKKAGHSDEDIAKSLTLIGAEADQIAMIATRIENVEITKSMDVESLIGGLAKLPESDFAKSADAKFAALGQLTTAVLQEQSVIKKSLEVLLNTPLQKSATNQTYKERFEKSENGNQGGAGMEVGELTSKLFDRASELRKSGTPDIRLENAVSELSLTKSTDMASINGHLIAVGYSNNI